METNNDWLIRKKVDEDRNNQNIAKLRKTISGGNMVAFVGSGISANSPLKYPTWEGLLDHLWSHSEGEPVDRSSYIGGLFQEAEDIQSKLGRKDTLTYIKRLFSNGNYNEEHKLICMLPFIGILTTNYDVALENAYSDMYFRLEVCQPEEIHIVINRILRGEKLIGHLHGDIEHLESIVFTKKDYVKRHSNEEFKSRLKSLFLEKSVLFLGYGFNEEKLKSILENINIKYGLDAPQHYIILPYEKNRNISQTIKHFKQFNIKVIFYDILENDTNPHGWVYKFLFTCCAPAIIKKVIHDYIKSEEELEDAIKFVSNLAKYVPDLQIYRTICKVLDELIDYIDKIKDEITDTTIINKLNELIKNNEINLSIDMEVNEANISFKNKNKALKGLENIKKELKKIFRNILKKIHPDKAKVSTSVELSEEFRTKLTTMLLNIKDETDIMKKILSMFQVMEQANISYSEVGIDDEDLADVAKEFQSYNAVEEQREKIDKLLDECKLKVDNNEKSINYIKKLIEHSKETINNKINELKTNLLPIFDDNDIRVKELLKKIIENLESAYCVENIYNDKT